MMLQIDSRVLLTINICMLTSNIYIKHRLIIDQMGVVFDFACTGPKIMKIYVLETIVTIPKVVPILMIEAHFPVRV